MARKTSLHPNRTDLLSEMLLGIADDVLHYVVRQRIVRFITDGDTRHRDVPLSLLFVAAILYGHSPAVHFGAVAR
jgi:hypothetical protein